MTWIFESLTLPRDDALPEACEDRVVVLPSDFAAVIDGAAPLRAWFQVIIGLWQSVTGRSA